MGTCREARNHFHWIRARVTVGMTSLIKPQSLWWFKCRWVIANAQQAQLILRQLTRSGYCGPQSGAPSKHSCASSRVELSNPFPN